MLFLLTLLVAVLWPTSGFNFLDRFVDKLINSRQLISGNLFNIGTKEKDEDENCEYEMIWDAEGSMHLVKRPAKTPSSHLTESGSVER